MSMSPQHVEVEAVGAVKLTPEATLASLFAGSGSPLSSSPGHEETSIFAQAKTQQGIRLGCSLRLPQSVTADPRIALQVIDQLWQECREAIQQQAQQYAQQQSRSSYGNQQFTGGQQGR